MEQELERLEGTVEDIIYLNEDNGYTVFEVSGGGVVTVVCGVVGELHAGESVVCRGRYENHATYGRQFHAQECETDMPKDLEAVYAFLASRSLPYIGARTADKIIDKFGAQALEIIANDPAQLTTIPGISADKADRIQQEFKLMFGMRELIAYLAQFEISPRRAMEVFRTFGPGAMQAIQQNPYLLCGEPLQLDFRHADSIAQYYQMAGDCAQRLEAALLRTLRHNAGNGHTCLPRAQLLETASNFIHQPPEKLAAALDSCIQTGKLAVRMFDGTPYIYLPDLLAAEQDIADRLAMLTKRGKQTAHGLGLHDVGPGLRVAVDAVLAGGLLFGNQRVDDPGVFAVDAADAALFLQLFQRADIAENALLGVLTHGAGVEQDEVGVFDIVAQAVADILQNALDLLAVVDVLLAAVAAYIRQRRCLIERRQRLGGGIVVGVGQFFQVNFSLYKRPNGRTYPNIPY